MSAAPHIVLRREPGALTRSFTALLVRCGLGMILLMAGFNKFQDLQEPPSGTESVVFEPMAPVDGEVEVQVETENDIPAEEPEPAIEEPTENPEANEEAASEEPARYPDAMKQQFEGTFLAEQVPWGLDLFTLVLPYAEMGLGIALILGVLTTLTGLLTGILFLSLLFGQIVLENASMYPNMLIYLLSTAVVLWLSPVTSNYLSVDGILFGWFWRPRPEGEYRLEESGNGRRG